jgi:CheY-like chemotaxis protein
LNLNNVVADLQKTLHHLLGNHILLILKPQPDLGYVRVDRGQLEQVIFNLAVNAVEAMPEGGELILETANIDVDETINHSHTGAPPGPYVLLTISDTGIGMTEETLAYIFEPFFTTKEVGAGTGLGLAMVHGIISQSGGHIQVYSQPGQGTTFKIYLPRPSTFQPSPKPPLEALRGVETILIIENDPQLRQLVVRTLMRWGYTILEGADRTEALLIYQNHPQPIHLLLTDVMIPELAAISSTVGGMRVLYMLAYSDDIIAPLSLSNPDLPFIEKPFTTTTLIQKIREVLDTPAT